jgi:hypothetical protein
MRWHEPLPDAPEHDDQQFGSFSGFSFKAFAIAKDRSCILTLPFSSPSKVERRYNGEPFSVSRRRYPAKRQICCSEIYYSAYGTES